MAYDQLLADRISQLLQAKNVHFYEKEMMGGITYMVDEKMCISIFKGKLMTRIDPDESEELLKKQGAERMMHGKREMKGYINVNPEGFDLDGDLDFWVTKCLEFNPKAAASKKKK